MPNPKPKRHSAAPGVPQTPTKATVGTLITSIGGLITLLVATVPNNDKVQLYGAILVGVCTVIANGYGVYATRNVAKVKNGNDWERGEHGAGEGRTILIIAAGVILGGLAIWLLLALSHDDKHDGLGNDWERHHHSVAGGNDWEGLTRR
jgi:hypothetical protein